ncbi:MAG: c-type cytochrome [bacterium]|nr:c-type cytochrome [bacterium]
MLSFTPGRAARPFLLLLLGVVLVSATPALAADEPTAEPAKTVKLDGKELFKTQCKTCHGAKAPAGEYTPMSLIQEQWEEHFDGPWLEIHGAVAAPANADKKVSDLIDAATLEAIRKFCIDHAADSEQPMTCG